MSAAAETRPLLVRFFDAFFQERNIKWVLAIGMMLLVGSSLMLVTTHWEEYTPIWKYLILLGYTGLIFLAGQFCHRRLSLPRTGNILLAVTVLLLPITFLALRWAQEQSLMQLSLHLALLTANSLFSFLAARRVFRHFLRDSQPTFLASYLTLCVAGAIVPALNPAWTPFTAVGLWAVFTAGVVKVNRHVFWLTEERRAPRIFGFFPIGLLGAQFLGLFAVHMAPSIPVPWLGLGCVLVAAPVLLTADTVARVFQERTGDLVRPLPWAIVLPLIVGLGLCATGVCLAATQIASGQAYALVPTAVLAAVSMGVVAHRTGKQAFVWAMLICVTIAYRYSPAYFHELVEMIRDGGALAVREPKLPIAFYGLTFLPLILGLMVGVRTLGRDLFVRPMRQFAVILSVALLALAFGHPKALLPVAAAMTLVFASQTVLFRDRRLALLGIVAFVVAAYGFTPFATQVLQLPIPNDAHLLCLTLAAGLLFLCGPVIESRLRRLPLPAMWNYLPPSTTWIIDHPCQLAGLVLAADLALFWLFGFGLNLKEQAHTLEAIMLAGLLLIHSLRWLWPVLSGTAIIFAQVVALRFAIAAGVPFATIASVATLILLAQRLLSAWLQRHPKWRVTRAFGEANRFVTTAWLLCGLIGLYLPLFARQLVPGTISMPNAVAAELGGVWWLCRLLIVAWCFDAARRSANGAWTILGCAGVLGLIGSTFVAEVGESARAWLPAAWAATGLVALVPGQLLHSRLRIGRKAGESSEESSPWAALSIPIDVVLVALLGVIALASLWLLTWPARVAGLLAVAGLLLFAQLRRQSTLRLTTLAAANWQIILLAVALLLPDARSLLDLARVDLSVISLPVALLAAASLLAWQVSRHVAEPHLREIARLQRTLLRAAVAGMLLLSFGLNGLNGVQIVLALAAFAVLVASELIAACRDGSEQRVWLAEGIALAAVGYFALMGVITLGHGLSLFAVLAAAVLLRGLAELVTKHEATRVMAGPFRTTSLVLPLVAVVLGVARHVRVPDPQWLGINSLGILLAAGFYFWRGVEEANKLYHVLAALILNVGLALFWNELRWTDPQWYMIPIGVTILALVELLRQEIPKPMHDPLRYVGALVILISPTFHIVEGSWVHLFTLMLASVGVVLAAIGLRVRALMYAGTGFLLADLVAMVVRGSIDNPNVLWLAGLGLGAGVVALGAVCENHREVLLQRLRGVSAALKAWD